MKFCPRPYEHMNVRYPGLVRMCSWMDNRSYLGNLLKEDLESIWTSDQAKTLRQSFEDGCFKYCVHHTCPSLNNNTLPDLSSDEYYEEVNKRPSNQPTHFNLAFDEICNHACPTCRNGIFKPDKNYLRNIIFIGQKLLPYLHKARFIMASGQGEVFASRIMLDLLSNIQPQDPNFEILLETNGVLLKQNWDKVQRFEKYKMRASITVNSFNRYTHKNLCGGFNNFDRLMESLRFASELRKDNRLKLLKFTFVIQDRNFREIPDIIRRSIEEFHADAVTLRPVLTWFKITKENYWFKNVLNPLNPYHEEYLDVMSDPICKHPKVIHWNGDNKVRKPVPIQDIFSQRAN